MSAALSGYGFDELVDLPVVFTACNFLHVEQWQISMNIEFEHNSALGFS